jgi:hypothetical protein
VLQPAVFDVQPLGLVVSQPTLQVSSAHREPALHVMSHAHDSPHDTFRQEFAPEQSTLHAPGPHVMSRQLDAPLHVMLHDLALMQLMPLRQPLPLHAMTHAKPAGQVICDWHSCGLTAQSMVHTCAASSHDVHVAGQMLTPPSTGRASGVPPESSATHWPSTHTRPPEQFAWVVHAKSPLRWLTEQPAAKIERTRATSFTVHLRR